VTALRRILPTAVLASALLVAAPLAHAATVQNRHDSGPGSLREAMLSAVDGETIKVPAGHYKLTSGALTTTAQVTVVGAGARKTVLDAQHLSRVFSIEAGPNVFHLAKVTVENGNGDDGGDGGGISLDSGSLYLKKVAVVHNIAGTPDSLSNGGGAFATDIFVTRSLFAFNVGYNGGAMAANSITGTDSTFAFNDGGSSVVGENGDGGAFDDPVTLIDSTVAFNRCFNGSSCGGGFDNTATLKGTLVAGNRGFLDNGIDPGSPGNEGSPDNCDGTVTSEGHNLESGNKCGFAEPGDLTHAKPKLGRLKDNGGQTDTLAISRHGDAFNAGAKACLARDQRGIKRPKGPRCDIGAFELKKPKHHRHG
jgi:hypothetical protein